jgi:hypothetical protein
MAKESFSKAFSKEIFGPHKPYWGRIHRLGHGGNGQHFSKEIFGPHKPYP